LYAILNQKVKHKARSCFLVPEGVCTIRTTTAVSLLIVNEEIFYYGL